MHNETAIVYRAGLWSPWGYSLTAISAQVSASSAAVASSQPYHHRKGSGPWQRLLITRHRGGAVIGVRRLSSAGPHRAVLCAVIAALCRYCSFYWHRVLPPPAPHPHSFQSHSAQCQGWCPATFDSEHAEGNENHCDVAKKKTFLHPAGGKIFHWLREHGNPCKSTIAHAPHLSGS